MVEIISDIMIYTNISEKRVLIKYNITAPPSRYKIGPSLFTALRY
jgi:hypothetical protein